MKKQNIVLIAITCVVMVVAVAWSVAYPSGTWRYKMTVTVETPEGIKSGSSVREVTISTPVIRLPEVTASKKVKGEAVVVDLGSRGVLFALISFDSYWEVIEAFPMKGATAPKGIRYYRSLKPGTKAPITKNLPRFVRFKDISDPKSVEPVDPRNLSHNFGDGVRLKEVVIEITDEPITSNVEDYLSWMGSIEGEYLDGKFSGGGPELSNILHGGNFKAGDK